MPGAANLIVEARAVLLDALAALEPHNLMVPEHLAGSGSRRGVRIPPH